MLWNLIRKFFIFEQQEIKGVSVNMSGFVFAFCVFPTSCNACLYRFNVINLASHVRKCKLGFYSKLYVDLSG